jgi:hypothetical protein
MKRSLFLCVLLLGLSAGCGEGSDTASRDVASPDEMFSTLDGYGTWMDVAGLGRVWQPAVSYDWRPFSDGQWVWTDRGWMWLSDEPFSWVVYHYGYWSHWGAAGWLWVPGYEWSPARVHWYAGEDFIGWAPLSPPGHTPPQAYEQDNIWVVVPPNQFTREHVGQYRTAAQRPILVPSQDRQRAPDVGFVRRATNQEIRRWRTESEDIRRGERTLTRVRVREEAPPGQVTPPPQVTPLPPAARPSPGTQQGEVRRSGTTRTPDTTGRTPGATTRTPGTTSGTPGATTRTPGTKTRTPGATTRTPGTTRKTPAETKNPPPTNVKPPETPRPAARDSAAVRSPKTDPAGKQAPQREGRR